MESIAFANVAAATFIPMDGDLQSWRQERLSALADEVGGKAELGRQLGYRSGAFVGQMIKGLRPITEKTVQAAERVRGPGGQTFKGWFSKDAPVAAKRAPGHVFEELTAEEQDLLENFRHMLDHDREELAAEIAMRAARAKTDVDKYIQRLGLTPRTTGAAARTRTITARAAAEVSPQKPLPLEPTKRRSKV